jgi:hypothetical protein
MVEFQKVVNYDIFYKERIALKNYNIVLSSHPAYNRLYHV